MQETTQISYGRGIVNIVLNSESMTEIDAVSFRFKDYEQVLGSCFTQKELEQIAEGEYAELTFNMVLKDPLSADLKDSPLSDYSDLRDEGFYKLNEGIYLGMNVFKSIGSKERSKLDVFYEDTEIKITIPEYLQRDNREYFFYSYFMGNTELYEDTDKEADTLSINTDGIGNGLILYKEYSFVSNAKASPPQGHQTQFLCLIGIVALIMLWKKIDQLHKKE